MLNLLKTAFVGATSVNFTVTGLMHLLVGVPLVTAFAPAVILGSSLIAILTFAAIQEIL